MSYAMEATRFMDSKVYVSPVEYKIERAQRRGRCYLLQITLCLIGVSILFGLGARCIYRAANKENITPMRKQLEDFKKLTSEYSDEVFDGFEQFLKFNNKTYFSIKEHWKRFTIFSKNFKEIQDRKAKAINTEFDAISPFTDLEDEELKKRLMPFTEAPRAANMPRFDTSPGWITAVNRPESFDWRDKGAVLGIKDQGQCGSCWSFAVVAVCESMSIIHGGSGNRRKLSEQELLDCDLKDNGCNGGFRPNAFKFVKEKGLVDEASYEYTAKKGQCKLPSGQNKSRVFVDEVYGFDPNENDMADWIATKGPITIGVNVTKGMFSYRSGVFSPTPEECRYQSLGSHAMAVIGYGTLKGEDYWLLKNSWGVVYGQAGYLKMRRGVNSCGIANNAYTALITKPHN
ncbi:hypothetical protein M3Y97_00281700 [Aphelenchoides bicaudatus]|nr:hypothetical protein M3Y97_00281700 [Aphelenchoides bicaudatus]